MKKMTVEEAAKLMGASTQFVRESLKADKFPWGVATKMPGGRYSYWISKSKFERWMNDGNMETN